MNFCFTTQSSVLMWIQGSSLEKNAISGLKPKSIWLVRFDAIKDSKGRLNPQMTNTRVMQFGRGLCPSSACSFKDCARPSPAMPKQHKIFKMLLMRFHLIVFVSCVS